MNLTFLSWLEEARQGAILVHVADTHDATQDGLSVSIGGLRPLIT